MPRPDPHSAPRAADKQRLRYAIRLVAAFALVVAVVACLLVAAGDDEFRPHMLVATGVGSFLTVMLGGALILVSYFSSASGHDQEVADFNQDKEP